MLSDFLRDHSYIPLTSVSSAEASDSGATVLRGFNCPLQPLLRKASPATYRIRNLRPYAGSAFCQDYLLRLPAYIKNCSASRLQN